MKELRNKIFKDTFVVMFSNIINYAGMFILAVIITRLLGVDALGEFTYIFAVSSILSVISEFGLSQLLIRKINSDRANVFFILKNVNIFKFFLSIICVITACLVFSVIPGNGFNLAFAAGITIIIPKAFQSTYEVSMRALMKQRLPSMLKSVNALIQIILAYLILIKTGSLLYMFLMMMAMESIMAAMFKIASVKIWKNTGLNFAVSLPYSFSQIKPLINEAFPFMGSNFLSLSIPRIIIIILENLSSQISVGIFSAATRFANGVGLFSGALYNTFYPAMTDPATPLNIRYSLAKKFSMYAFTAGLIISLVLYFSAGLLIDITFKIPEAVTVLKLMGFVVIPILVYSVIQPFLFSLHLEKFILKTYLIVWLFNIFCSVYLVQMYGYMGAAVSAVIVDYLILVILILKFYNIKLNNE